MDKSYVETHWISLPARGAVHFQSIEDKFTPHDAVFAFATAEELKDTALSHEIALHTAASIRSVSESHLSGITEDEGDAKSEVTQKADISDQRENTVASPSRDDAQTRHEKIAEILSAMRQQESTTTHSPPLGSHERKDSDTDKALPPLPQKPLQSRSPQKTPKPQSIYEFESRPSFSSVTGRMSSQSARPSPRDLDWAYDYKTKVKLGPRPSVDNRPSTAGGNGVFRPVSTLPAGLRMPTRKPAPGRPQSEQKHALFSATPSPSVLLPRHPGASQSTPQGSRQPITPATPLSSDASTRSEQSTMTPEKRRLMKALEIRNKQLAARKTMEHGEAGAVPDRSKDHESKKDAATLGSTNAPATGPLQNEGIRHLHDEQARDKFGAVHKTPPTHDVDPQDSPISVAEPSDGQSTQASSVSEDTSAAQKPQIGEDTELHELRDSAPSSITTIDAASSSLANRDQNSPLPSPAQDLSREDTTDEPKRPLTTIFIKDSTPAKGQSETAANRETSNFDSSSVVDIGDKGSEFLPSTRYETNDATSAIAPIEAASTIQTSSTGEVEPRLQSPSFEEASLKSVKQPKDSSSENFLPIQNPEDDQIHQDHPNAAALATSGAEELVPKDGKIQHSKPDTVFGLGIVEIGVPGQTSTTPSPVRIEQGKTEHGGAALSGQHASRAGPEVPNDVAENLEKSIGKMGQAGAASHTKFSDAQSESQDVGASVNQDNQEGDDSPAPPTHAARAELRTRRRGVVSPLQRTSSPDPSDDQFLSDESFMEELKTAAVQEAKPVSVSKSPIKPVFSRSSSEPKTDKPRPLRSVSSPLAIDNKEDLTPPLPTTSSGRSFSASATNFLPAGSKKTGVSSSISQRIKALESLSTRPTSPTLQTTPQATFISISDRKNSLRSPPGSPELANDTSRPATANPSPANSPHLTTLRRLDNPPKPRPESMTVTATIVRDAKDRSADKPSDPSDPYKSELHQSPIVVHHQSMIPPPLSPLHPPRPQFARNASSRSSASADQGKQMSPKMSRRESFASWRSGSSRNGSDLDLPHSASDKSLNSGSGPDGSKEEKRDSRGRRFLKRMSSITAGSKKGFGGTFSPGPKEAAIAEHQEPVEPAPSAALDLGDLNIQFPDTLLWKPRRMVVDESGVLVLSPSSTERNPRIITKQFSLTDFRPPYIPDQDRQELPHSACQLCRLLPDREADDAMQVSFLISRTEARFNVPARHEGGSWRHSIVSIYGQLVSCC